MAVITAKGRTEYGNITVRIEGTDMVEKVESSREFAGRMIKQRINSGEGYLANNYHPEKGTMLQAYALLLQVFREQDISVEGDIGEMESEPGFIY